MGVGYFVHLGKVISGINLNCCEEECNDGTGKKSMSCIYSVEGSQDT